MKEIKYTDVLFGGAEETYLSSKMKIRKIAPAGMGYSKARGDVTSGVKTSRALLALDILDCKSANAAASKDGCYLEIYKDNSLSAKVYYQSDINVATVQNLSCSLRCDYMGLIAIVFYAISKKEELARCTKNIFLNPSSNDIDLFTFCDSFYFDIAKPQMQFMMAEDTVPEIDFSKYAYIDALRDIQNSLPELSVPIGKRKTPKTPKSKVDTDLYEQVKKGKYIIPYEWNNEQKEKITPLSYLDTYVPCEAFYSILRKIKRKSEKILERLKQGGSIMDIIGNDYVNLFLVGKPGSGKTVLAYAISAATGIPVYTIVFSKDTDEEEFEGKTRIVDGKAQFVETDFLKAYKNGGIVVLEEVNLANPAVVMGSLGQAVEFPFVLKENGYKTVNRNPMFFVISTMNVGTNGSNTLNQAFSNRHKQDYIMDDPGKDSFIEILASKGYKKTDCSKVYKVYEKIVNYLKSSTVDREDICDTLSMRTCLGCLDNMEDGDEFFTAVKNSIVGKVAESDLEIAKDIEEQVLAYLV